jgi:DNA-binding HxlR family transcriptional regulator
MEMWFDGSQGTGGPEGLGPVPPETAYRLLGAKWIPAIIRALGRGGLRYRDLDRRLPGVSQKVLTQNLNRLERSGLVWRQPRRESWHRYCLTSSGRSLLSLVEEVDRQAGRLGWSGAPAGKAVER